MCFRFRRDTRLGEHDGVELVRLVLASGSKAPVIMLTGQGERRVDLEATKAGAADYLVKECITSAGLERSFRHALERNRKADELRVSEELPGMRSSLLSEISSFTERSSFVPIIWRPELRGPCARVRLE